MPSTVTSVSQGFVRSLLVSRHAFQSCLDGVFAAVINVDVSAVHDRVSEHQGIFMSFALAVSCVVSFVEPYMDPCLFVEGGEAGVFSPRLMACFSTRVLPYSRETSS